MNRLNSFAEFFVSSPTSDRRRKFVSAHSPNVVRVLGEFPKIEADGLIALKLVEEAANRELQPTGELVIGVDVTRFGTTKLSFSRELEIVR